MERLLATHGPRELNVNAVMADAGLARTVFYRHFTDLSELILESLDELQNQVFTFPADGSAGLTDPEFQRAILRQTVDFFLDNAALIRALEDFGRGDPKVAAAHEEFMARSIGRLTALFDEEVAAGRMTFPSTYEIARALHLLNTSYLLDFASRDAAGDRDLATETLRTIWARTMSTHSL